MQKTVAIASVLVVAVGLVGMVGFGFGGRGHGRDPARMQAMLEEHVDDTLDDLDATPDQRTRIHAIVDRVIADARRQHEGHASVHDELLAQWKSDRPDAAKVRGIVDQRIQEMRTFADQGVDALIQVHGVLTPEQRERLAKKIERRHGHR